MLSSTRRECKPALVQPRACSRPAKSSRNVEILMYMLSSAPFPLAARWGQTRPTLGFMERGKHALSAELLIDKCDGLSIMESLNLQ